MNKELFKLKDLANTFSAFYHNLLAELFSLGQYRLWSFQRRDTKLERSLESQRKLLNFVNLCNGEVSKSARI